MEETNRTTENGSEKVAGKIHNKDQSETHESIRNNQRYTYKQSYTDKDRHRQRQSNGKLKIDGLGDISIDQ